ncbi:hypothetical protein GCM10008025_22970 [Ornithinibacillus halotolerans]|uniref:Amidohydrolase n=1 Tax=Ornithinibacillus halotolerans TaxID=1274357 RepID=A0A916S1G2_9BACI|nr:hypothetical protein GCM10008025_22970 [Ornithinibacillus halotolerans]
MENVTRATCTANGATVDFEYIKDCPSMYNDPIETKHVVEVANNLVGSENVITGIPMMGSEDFAFYQKEISGVYFTVGGRNEEINAIYPHHHPKFNVDERAMIEIGKMFISLVME